MREAERRITSSTGKSNRIPFASYSSHLIIVSYKRSRHSNHSKHSIQLSTLLPTPPPLPSVISKIQTLMNEVNCKKARQEGKTISVIMYKVYTQFQRGNEKEGKGRGKFLREKSGLCCVWPLSYFLLYSVQPYSKQRIALLRRTDPSLRRLTRTANLRPQTSNLLLYFMKVPHFPLSTHQLSSLYHHFLSSFHIFPFSLFIISHTGPYDFTTLRYSP